MKKLVSKHVFGDMLLCYVLDTERGCAGLCAMPACKEADLTETSRRISVQSLVECKVLGDDYSGNYFGGSSMKYSGTTDRLRYDRQTLSSCGDLTTIHTYLSASDGLEAVHRVQYRTGSRYFTVSVELKNGTQGDVVLEALSTFALFGISPYGPETDSGSSPVSGAGENPLVLHRLRSRWSLEGRLVSEPFEDLLLEDSWTCSNARSERFGQVGSMPVKGYFPFMAVTDTAAQVIWGVQMGTASSWQMEVTRSDACAAISGGLADREMGHWMKKLGPGETFSTGTAALSVCLGGVDEVCPRLLEAQEDALDVPECEETLPVLFNEYCTTWGCPSQENIREILDAIDGFGMEYFVIDCGWYKADGVPWYLSMGDYQPSASLFPEGIDETVRLIREHGMKAGIWFEIENVGCASEAYHRTEHLLKRDGLPLTTVNRRFWDMQDPWVQEYLTQRVIDFLKEHHFEYLKIDYNDTIGIGCDHPDSLGEGLRRNMEGTVDFFRKLRREIPDLVMENCASGGHRLEPLFLSLCSQASFSDAHECVEIPIIAANLHRAVLPRQTQIWCVIRQTDSLKRIAYSIAATFLGRMCLSGDVTRLTEEQRALIQEGIAFYRMVAGLIKHGESRIVSRRAPSDRHALSGSHISSNGPAPSDRYALSSSHTSSTGPALSDCYAPSDRHPEGYQALLRSDGQRTLMVLHTFGGALPERVEIPCSCEKILACYPESEAGRLSLTEGRVVLERPEEFEGFGLLLE